MTKNTKKKNRKLRKQIRKTCGALLMASAIAVAAIPVSDTEAATTTLPTNLEKVKVVNYTSSDMNAYEQINGAAASSLWQSEVPYVKADETIYTDETGTFQFAFIPAKTTSTLDVAVILGITPSNIQNGNLTIPDDVDAYKKYVANSTNTGLCAVNRRDKYLYYQISVHAQSADKAYLFDSLMVNQLDSNGMRVTDDVTGAVKQWDIAGKITSKSPGMVQKSLEGGGTAWYYSQTEYYQVTEYDPDKETGVTRTVSEVKEYYATPKMTTGYAPCYREDYETWKDDQLYYWEKADATVDDPDDTTSFHPVGTGDTANARIQDAVVEYIGRQNVTSEDGIWKVGGVAEPGKEYNGVFYNIGQIVNLTIGDKLVGIGDYAFYRCTGIQTVTLGSNLNTIGNGAFANCNAMHTFNMQLHSQISVLGKEAFLNCEALNQIDIPVSVDAIGDSCFSGCTGLKNIYMCAESEVEGIVSNPNLTTIGVNAFGNCSSLVSLTFPGSYSEKLPVIYLWGCTNLQYIKGNNVSFDIIDGLESEYSNTDEDKTAHNDRKGNDNDGCDIMEFISTLKYAESFYFEGEDNYLLHQTAKDHSAAFKYANTSPVRFEKVVLCPEPEDALTGAPHEATYIIEIGEDGVSSSLVDMQLDPRCKELEIPGSIGGYGIDKISSGSFLDNCFLTKLTIPNTVQEIESNAFRGCHNLKFVIFSQPNNPNLIIGQGAFNTQQVSSHVSTSTISCDGEKDSEPFLSFTGDISDENGNLSSPFRYAMNPSNNIDTTGQEMNSYITYYSGWPSNLTVKYNPETGENELVDYPRYDEITSYTVFDLNKADRNSLPYVTAESAEAAREAVNAINAYNSGTSLTRPTQEQYDIVNAALNINLPAGITAIADGIFSGVDSDNEQAFEIVWKQDPATGKWKKEKQELKLNDKIETITMNTVEEIDPYTFSQCKSLTGFYMAENGGQKIDDYAFKDCTKLANVEVAGSVSELGLRPFVGCSTLTGINFMNSPYFTCGDSIIYGLSGGKRDSIVECLEARGLTTGSAQVGPDEVAGVTSIRPEAFKQCDGIGTVDLTSAVISEVPEQCFVQTSRLSNVTLPNTTRSINKGAFWNSNIFWVKVPDSVTYIEPEAFATVKTTESTSTSGTGINPYTGEIELDAKGDPTICNVDSGNSTITMVCAIPSAAETFANRYYYINPTEYVPEVYHTVYFWDDYEDRSKPILIETKEVLHGTDAPLPSATPTHAGVSFSGWGSNYQNIVRDTDVYAQFSGDVYTVWFQYTDMTDPNNPKIIKLTEDQVVEDGKSATPPSENPYIAGYVFVGWAPDYKNIHNDGPIIAVFKSASEEDRHTVTFYDYQGNIYGNPMKVEDGGSVMPPTGPARDGYTFLGWIPNDFTNITSDKSYVPNYEKNTGGGTGGTSPAPSGSASASPNASASASPSASPNPADSVKKYTVSVSGGSGSGSYAAGEVVAINAYDMGTGQVFDKWTSSTAGVGFANPNATSTTFTMPAANVSITATYKTGNSANSTNSNSTNSANSNGSRAANGTTVQVTKPGISNTNLAGATVSGATDNFIVKVTEDDAAAQAATAALQARYGDLSRIKYFPMDISLYDSEGRTKIADTSGISVNLTLPLPDDLIQYAGNNKVAAIANGALEDLNTRFTTVDGVPCVNFTATHFSPYVIYVDTANLTQPTIDATPKTGDPIHPKWFLAIGLACISLILFFKRDKVTVKAA